MAAAAVMPRHAAFLANVNDQVSRHRTEIVQFSFITFGAYLIIPTSVIIAICNIALGALATLAAAQGYHAFRKFARSDIQSGIDEWLATASGVPDRAPDMATQIRDITKVGLGMTGLLSTFWAFPLEATGGFLLFMVCFFKTQESQRAGE